MLPSNAAKPFSCISCGSSFKRSGDLASHLTQAAKCHWVLKQREQIQAAEIPDYREASDQESDPPAESDPFFPYEDMDVLAEDIFNEESPNEGQSSRSATNPQTNGQTHVTVEEMLDEDNPDFYDADARSRMGVMPATLVILLAVAVTKVKCIYCCKVLLHGSYTGRFDFPLAVLLQPNDLLHYTWAISIWIRLLI